LTAPDRELLLDVAVDYPEFSLSIDRRVRIAGVTALFGPSGAGKSTLLRIIAGLEPRARGLIRLDESTWLDSGSGRFVPPHARAVAMVFQRAYLFEHLSLSSNLRYGLRRRGARRGPEWQEVKDALDLGPLLDRPVSALSGGERQRVSIGQALLSAPRLLLFDEPLSGLDDRRKTEILRYLRTVIERFGIPAIFVSHSVGEVRSIATDVISLEAGRIVGCGPRSLPTAGGVGGYLEATVCGYESEHLVTCSVGGQIVQATGAKLPVGCHVTLEVHGASVGISAEGRLGILHCGSIAATVEALTPGRTATDTDLLLKTAGGVLELALTLALLHI